MPGQVVEVKTRLRKGSRPKLRFPMQKGCGNAERKQAVSEACSTKLHVKVACQGGKMHISLKGLFRKVSVPLHNLNMLAKTSATVHRKSRYKISQTNGRIRHAWEWETQNLLLTKVVHIDGDHLIAISQRISSLHNENIVPIVEVQVCSGLVSAILMSHATSGIIG